MLTKPNSCPRTGSCHRFQQTGQSCRTFFFYLLMIAFALSSHAQYISTIAGTGTAGYTDSMAATAAKLKLPFALTLDAAGNVYIVDNGNHRIRMISVSTGLISTIAGTGSTGTATSASSIGDGGPATAAKLNLPEGIVADASGNVYISDYNDKRIRKITAATGIISTIAGTGVQGYSGDGAAATLAKINAAQGLALDLAGDLYIADAGNNRIRKVTLSTGIITTVAGTGTAGFSGDGGAAMAAKLNYPSGIAFDAAGNLFIADNSNNRIREVFAGTGKITTIAGTGSAAYSGDGGVATAAAIKYPQEVALDRAGNLYISDVGNSRVRKITTGSGIISTVAGNGTAGYSGDGVLATAASLYAPDGIAFDASDNMYIADGQNNRIRKVTSDKSTLPVTLVSFDVRNGSGNVAEILWQSASEINSCYYDVERSPDAEYFTVIANVVAAGNSVTEKEYNYTDRSPLSGTSYYRLHEKDCDGRSMYGEIAAYTRPVQDRISMYPNPSHGEVHVEMKTDEGYITIINTLGKVVYASELKNTLDLRLPPGIYLVIINEGGRSSEERLVIE